MMSTSSGNVLPSARRPVTVCAAITWPGAKTCPNVTGTLVCTVVLVLWMLTSVTTPAIGDDGGGAGGTIGVVGGSVGEVNVGPVGAGAGEVNVGDVGPVGAGAGEVTVGAGLGAGAGAGWTGSAGEVDNGFDTAGAVVPIAGAVSSVVRVRGSGTAFGAALPPPPHAESSAVLSNRSNRVEGEETLRMMRSVRRQ